RASNTRATTLPALGGLLGGLLFALGAALLVDRADRTIRDPEEAALTFGAPVLSIIPSDGEEFAVLAEPNSLAAEAYRGLAAMAIATDRLPKAMMVSTPTGEAHAQVAANLAAALSRLGLKVALMAGPALLEEADATLVAWATRNVLWAIIPGEVTRAEARAAAARMELAGVTPFGVVMVEPQTPGV